ncbi:MAG: MMPL family transporter [Acidobacteriota bacterium]
MIPRGILVRIEDFARRHHLAVFVATALAVAGALLLGRGLTLETDILAFLPEEDPEIGRFVSSLRDFGSLDHLLVLLEAPPGASMEDHLALGDDLAARLAKLPEVEYVDHRLDLDSPIFRLLRRHAVLYLDDTGIDALEAALTDEQIRARVAHLRAVVSGPLGSYVKDLARRDPLGLAPLFLPRLLAGRGGALRMDLSTGTYLSPDGSAQILIVKPTHPPQDIAFDERLESELRRCFEEASAGIVGARPTMKLGGAYIIALEDAKLVKSDIKLNAAVSFVAVVALYLFCYRRLAAIVYSVTPLVVGQALTFALAVLVMGKLSSLTAGFTAMLMGLGTDFTIVMYARYVEERRMGASLATATHRMMGETALGVFTGAITSAGTFAALCVTRFPGLRDFGFLVGSGILLCMVAILFLLPAMIAWHDGRPGRGDVRALYLHSFGVERLFLVADRFPRSILAGCAALTLLAAAGTLRIETSDSYRDLRAPDNRGFLVQEEIADRFGGSFRHMIVVARGATLAEAMERSTSASRRLDRWVENGQLAGYDSLATYVPAEARQRRVLERLEAVRASSLSPDRVAASLRAALAAEGFRREPFEESIDDLVHQLRLERAVDLADVQEAAGRLVRRFVKEADGEHRVATFVFPARGAWGDSAPAEFLRDVAGGDPHVGVTGLNVVGITVKRMFREDAARAFAIGLALVAALLVVDFRSIRLALYGMAQLLVGIIWLLGGMAVLGIQMNFVNAFATTMILGVGIDYGIHVTHRAWEERSLTSAGVLETGKAVVMAALTNVAGFGTVALSGYPGIRSMGMVSLLGTVACLLTSLTLLPALLKLFPEGRAAPPPSD